MSTKFPSSHRDDHVEPRPADLSASGPTGGTRSHGDDERPNWNDPMTWEGDNA